MWIILSDMIASLTLLFFFYERSFVWNYFVNTLGKLLNAHLLLLLLLFIEATRSIAWAVSVPAPKNNLVVFYAIPSLGARFSLLATRFPVLGSRFSVLVSRSAVVALHQPNELKWLTAAARLPDIYIHIHLQELKRSRWRWRRRRRCAGAWSVEPRQPRQRQRQRQRCC